MSETEVIVSEAGMLKLAMTADTEPGKRVRAEIIEIVKAWKRGRLLPRAEVRCCKHYTAHLIRRSCALLIKAWRKAIEMVELPAGVVEDRRTGCALPAPISRRDFPRAETKFFFQKPCLEMRWNGKVSYV